MRRRSCKCTPQCDRSSVNDALRTQAALSGEAVTPGIAFQAPHRAGRRSSRLSTLFRGGSAVSTAAACSRGVSRSACCAAHPLAAIASRPCGLLVFLYVRTPRSTGQQQQRSGKPRSNVGLRAGAALRDVAQGFRSGITATAPPAVACVMRSHRQHAACT